MPTVLIFHGRSTADGKIDWNDVDAKRLTTMLRHMKPGTELEGTVQKLRKRATDRQRKYYWAVICGTIAEVTGHTKEEIHEHLKWTFLKVDCGDGIVTVKSTEKLTTVEKEEYHRQCRQWADEFLGVYVALPNEVEF